MAAPSPPAPAPSSLTLPAWAVYIGLAVLLVGSVVASYVLKIFPDAFAQVGGGAAIIAVFTFAAHDFEAEGMPSGWPRWTSFVVVTVAAVGMGAVGQFGNMTLLTVAAFVTWITLVLTLLYHAIASDGGTTFSLNAETWFCALVGVGISLAVWFLDNPTAGAYAFLAAAVPIVTTYFHVGAGAVSPVPIGSQPAPPTPAVPAKA